MHRFSLDPASLSREEPIGFAGPAGWLEGLWRPPLPGRQPRGTVVVAHPHPAFGGTMLHKVIFHTARVLNHDLDLASLRFNFRGAGRSEGAHDGGRGEVDDLRAAWREARRRVPVGPLVAAGFSFGAAMALRAAASAEEGDKVPDALALIGIPLERYPPPDPFPVPIPAAVVHGEKDEFVPAEAVGAYLEKWPGPAAFRVLPGADHFLEGLLPDATGFLSRRLADWL